MSGNFITAALALVQKLDETLALGPGVTALFDVQRLKDTIQPLVAAADLVHALAARWNESADGLMRTHQIDAAFAHGLASARRSCALELTAALQRIEGARETLVSARQQKLVSMRDIDGLIRAVCANFRTFGGGQEPAWGNPIAAALKNEPPTFAAGVDVREVVDYIVRILLPPRPTTETS